MSASEKFQADLHQTKADLSQLKSETERKVDDAKAKVGAQLASERAKDEAVFRAANEKDEAFYRKERDKDEAVFRTAQQRDEAFYRTQREKDEAAFRAARADAKLGLEKLKAQRAELKATIGTKAGEARAKVQAELDSIDAKIAAAEAATEATMSKYFDTPAASEIELDQQ